MLFSLLLSDVMLFATEQVRTPGDLLRRSPKRSVAFPPCVSMAFSKGGSVFSSGDVEGSCVRSGARFVPQRSGEEAFPAGLQADVVNDWSVLSCG